MDDDDFDPIHLFDNNRFPRGDTEIVNVVEESGEGIEDESNVQEDQEQTPEAEHLDEMFEDLTGDNLNPVQDNGLEGLKARRTELCSEDRSAAYNMLLQRSVNGKLKKFSTREVADIFHVNIRSIQRLWKRGRDSGNHNISQTRVKNCGRKRIEFDLQKIRDIPLRDRTTLKSLAEALGISKTYLIRKLKCGELKRHSNTIKPTLTEANCLQRVRHCLSMIDPDSTPNSNHFYDMKNVVHIDEKWFQTTRKVQTYYLLADEEEPVRTIKSTTFIPKVMFLAAIARPRYDSFGNCTFDGKIGLFPLVTRVAAMRSSSNRLAGTLELKPITKIDRDVIREFMINHILPAIKAKWPRDSLTEEVIIQQDNAKTHIHSDDVDFLAAVENVGLHIKLLCQPPNSPDLNVLDLGFFRAIQSLQERKCANNLDQLVAAVNKVFLEYSNLKVNSIFITLQSCMIEIMKIMGSNAYKIPHMKKEQLARLGILPSTLSCDLLILATAAAHVADLPCTSVIVDAICSAEFQEIEAAKDWPVRVGG